MSCLDSHLIRVFVKDNKQILWLNRINGSINTNNSNSIHLNGIIRLMVAQIIGQGIGIISACDVSRVEFC